MIFPGSEELDGSDESDELDGLDENTGVGWVVVSSELEGGEKIGPASRISMGSR